MSSALLYPSVEEVLKGTVKERLNYFSNRVVGHRRLLEARDYLMSRSRLRGNVQLVFFYGVTGVGKTTVVKRTSEDLRRLLLQDAEQDPNLVPVVYVRAWRAETGSFGWHDIYCDILKALDEPHIDNRAPRLTLNGVPHSLRHRGKSAREMRQLAVESLKQHGVNVLFVDEAQHMQNVSSAKLFQAQLDILKSLADETGVLIVLIGPYELVRFLELSPQLARRSERYYFGRYLPNNPADRQEFTNMVPPWVLVTRDLASGLPGAKASCDGHCDLFSQAAVSVNSNCATAREVARVVESLTFRHDLAGLTMGFLEGKVEPVSLMHAYEHWCPVCLEEWRREGKDIYIPLAWQVRATTMCPRHQCRLEEKCLHCHRHHRPLARHGDSGFCPWCHSWLGAQASVVGTYPATELDHGFALFMAREVCDLIVNRDKVLGAAKGLFAQNVRTLIRRQLNTFAAFSREIGYHHKTVMMWAENRQKPRLGALLVLSYRFGLRAIDLIASHLEEGPVMCGRILPLCSVQRLKPTLHKHDINVLRGALEEAIRNEQSPPPSVASIGRRLGCHSSTLKEKYPELTKMISAQYRQYWSIHKSQRLFFTRLIVKSRTSEIAAKGDYPSWRKVTRTLSSNFKFGPAAIEAWREALRDWGLRPPES